MAKCNGRELLTYVQIQYDHYCNAICARINMTQKNRQMPGWHWKA